MTDKTGWIDTTGLIGVDDVQGTGDIVTDGFGEG